MRNIVKIGFVIASLWFCLIALEQIFDFGLKHNQNIKLAYVKNNRIDADILIHGPCEPLWMISPAILDKQTKLKSYNLALSHSDFADNFLHLYIYLKYNKAPAYLFLYVTPESFDEHYNTFNTYRFSPYLNDSVVTRVLATCDSSYYKWINIPFMKYAYYNHKQSFNVLQGYKHWFTNRSLPYYPNGFEPPAKIAWDNHLEKFIQLYPKGYHFKWSMLREKYLLEIIKLAKSKKIKLFLYESPVLNEAKAYQPNRNEILSKIELLAKKNNIKYILFDSMDIANSRKYFISILNLNLKGSEIFSDSLGKYVQEKILNSNRLN